MSDAEPVRLTVATFNVKRGGWDEGARWHDHRKLVDTLSKYDPPHILFLSECTMYRAFNSEPLWNAVARLNELWGGDDFYLPFLSNVPGSRNTPGLFVSARHVRPVEWYDPLDRDTRGVMGNVLKACIAGMTVFLQCVHWNGAKGPAWFSIESALTGQLASRPTLLGGDFNVPSSDVPLLENWGDVCATEPWKRRQKGVRVGDKWVINTSPMDELLADGFWDAGQGVGDCTPTVNDWVDNGAGLPIDKIVGSRRLPARLVPGSYHVDIPDEGSRPSDHRMVRCQLDFHPDYAQPERKDADVNR